MTPEQRKLEEEQIKNNFSELQKKLEDLRNEVQTETDNSKKQEKGDEIQKLEKELSEMKSLIDTLSSLQEEDLQSLKTKLESTKKAYQEYRWEVADLQNEKASTPTTCELLKNSETYNRLLNIISSNSDKFKNLPWETAEKKLEYIFEKARSNIVLFMKNKLWKSENIEKVINNTIVPAFEWSLMEMLRDQWNETNISMLKWIDKISWEGKSPLKSFNNLLEWVWNFAKNTTWSYNKFSQWINAVDYLSVHNGILHNPNKSQVLSNPLEFQKYMNDARFAAEWYSPYATISDNIFRINENQTFDFGVSLQEKQEVLQKIWNIQVADNPKTTALIAKILDKPEKLLQKTEDLQKTANGLLNWVNTINSVTKMFWIDLLWESSKAPEERWLLYKIMDFVCKFIWITWWLEWVVKKWRLDRLNFTDEKNENIRHILKKYQELAWNWTNVSIWDVNSCIATLADFAVTDLDKSSATKWDQLRDVMADSLDINLISPQVVQQTLWNEYLKKEIVTENGSQQEKIFVDADKIKYEHKEKELTHKHIQNMKTHLESNFDNLKDFYANIKSTDDIVLCITASLYADKDDIIEWVKAKVFLPENYGVVYWLASNWWWNSWLDRRDNSWDNSWKENLDSVESSDKQKVSEQWIYNKAIEYGITNKSQIAYVLSTIKWESWFKNQKEIWWENKKYWKVDSSTWKAYYGRWFIQITHKANYQKYTQIIQSSWKDFKDNNWNTIKWNEIDLVKNPDIILESNDLAVFIAMDWMKNWWPNRQESKKLDHYINDNKQDFYNARSIINWMSSNPKWYEEMAKSYLNKLWNNTIKDEIA